MITFLSDKAAQAIAWLRDNYDALRAIVADYSRLQNKVDNMRGGGDVRVTNPHSAPITISRNLDKSKPSSSSTESKIVALQVQSASLINDYQWEYTCNVYDATGLLVQESGVTAYNLLEYGNPAAFLAGTGYYPIGVRVASVIEGRCEILPFRSPATIPGWKVGSLWYFSMANSIGRP